MNGRWQIFIFNKTKIKKLLFFLLLDIALISFAGYLSFFLRFDGVIMPGYQRMSFWYILLVLPITIFFLWSERQYAITWSFVSIQDLLKLVKAFTYSFLLISVVLFILKRHPLFIGLPRSIPFIFWFLSIIFTGALRFSKRLYLHGFHKEAVLGEKPNVLIFGAGEAGEQLVRYMQIHNSYHPVGFIDDNMLKRGTYIHNVRVLGDRHKIPKILSNYPVDELIIAIPSAQGHVIREAVKIGRQAGIRKIKILPSTKEILEEKISLSNIRDLSIEDLLGRDLVKADTTLVKNFLKDKTVLVTGAAGSIGAHLCKHILNFEPKHLIALDIDETGIFHLERKLKPFASSKTFVIGNICDKIKIHSILKQSRPQLVFHAAAYKHVPLMEEHPDEAIKNNIFGTLAVAEAALAHHVEKFVFISTDKAVNPVSVMGMTKRVGEKICQSLNQKNATRFVAVRFGNVLDSRGNVISVFKKQIERGGPVEVTHPDMKRYFMATAEAVLLVLQAAAMSEQGGEIFVLDMGEPIKILDLAKEMIRLSGFEPDKDVPIVFSDIRPGERLFENILTAEEGVVATKNQKIFIVRSALVDEMKLQTDFVNLENAVNQHNFDELIVNLKMAAYEV